MAFEIETFDVENHEVQQYVNWMGAFGWHLKSSQRIYNRTKTPTSAIAFENVVLVNSSTEVDDFTELVFERDKNMPYYDEISTLENEALELLPYYSQKRPLKPSDKMTFKEWISNTKPRVFPLWIDILRTLALFGFLTFFAQFLSIFVDALSDMSDLGTIIVYGALICSVIITVVSNNVLRKMAVVFPKKKIFFHIMSEYSEYSNNIDEQQKKYDMFDEAAVRIPEIIKEAAWLLEKK